MGRKCGRTAQSYQMKMDMKFAKVSANELDNKRTK